MRDELVERLRTALVRPEHWATQTYGAHAARAQSLLREHVVRCLDEALACAGVRALVVKGEALARTVYPEHWMRFMSDIDLLVPTVDHERVLSALLAAGFERAPEPRDRPHSLSMFHETCLLLPVGEGAFCVEVHTALDKIVRRRIDIDGVMQRATQLGSLLLPSNEDQLLMVVLHAATADFDHAFAWLDMHLLLGAPLALPDVVARAEAWELCTALFVAMHALRGVGSDRVPNMLLETSRPGAWRRRLLDRSFDLDRFPMHGGARPDGLWWAVRQLPLRDDSARWLMGCAGYGVVRVLERVFARPSRSAAIASPTAPSSSIRRG